MHTVRNTIWILAALSLTAQLAPAQVPVSGMPVPELAIFDTIMQDVMDDNDISAGVLGVMKDGRIVYLRGFGWLDQARSTPLPETAMMRLASVTKPVTAAAINCLIEDGVLHTNQQVFNLGQPDGGILNHEPFPEGELGDERLEDITIWSVLHHYGGWERNAWWCEESHLRCDTCVLGNPCPICEDSGDTCVRVGDLTYREIDIWNDMQHILDTGPPPGRDATVRWILGQPLQVRPGTFSGTPDAERHYSNIGYLLLGLILEQEGGMDYIDFVRQHVLTKSMWFPATEFEVGHTYPDECNPREPWYDNPGTGQDVFHPNDPDYAHVPAPYGTWDHEARVGQGALVSTAVPLLHYLENYCVNDWYFDDSGGSTWDYAIGTRRTTILGSRDHGGLLRGTNTLARQRGDGINYVILLNKDQTDDNKPHYTGTLFDLLEDAMDSGDIAWPTRSVDGVWLDFLYGDTEQGSFDMPYNSLADLSDMEPYSKVRIKAFSVPWTGTIDTPHIALTALEGSSVIIGQ